MVFKIGQKVVFLNEPGGGIIKSIDEMGRYVIDDEDGFTRTYFERELAQIYGEKHYTEDFEYDEDIARDIPKSSVRKKSSSAPLSSKWEIDLHIECLVDSHVNMSNSEIIRTQMNAFKSFLEKAQLSKVKSIVVIHGVGEGVLKHEIRSYIDKYDWLTYADAYYGEYGKGATEIRITYS